MNDLKELRNLFAVKEESVRLGTVSEVVDADRLVVRLDVGAYRRVFGQASAGERVTVAGNQLHSRVPLDALRTAFVA